VVGADGAWSQVRSAISSFKPEYTGVTMVEVQLPNVDARFPELGKMVGPGSLLASDDNKALIAQRNANSHIRTYITLRVPEDWTKTSNIPFETDPKETRTRLLEYYWDWAPELRKLIERCDDSFVPRGIYQMPIGLKWEHKPGITVRCLCPSSWGQFLTLYFSGSRRCCSRYVTFWWRRCKSRHA
jgi:hypothetical protein